MHGTFLAFACFVFPESGPCESFGQIGIPFAEVQRILELMKSESEFINICDHPNFDTKDFGLRWQKARLSALRSLLSEKVDSLNCQEQDLAAQEMKLLSIVPDELHDQILRRVFDYSRQLGVSISKFLGLSFEISDFSEILAETKTPCFLGKWRIHNDAHVLERKGCASLSTLKSFGCDYWREALDGLVTGAGDTERVARHRSLGHGDEECLDVLFTENYSVPRVVSRAQDKTFNSFKKYGSVPAELTQALEGISTRFKNMKVQLYVDGFSEGALYYRLETDEGVLCGAGGKLLHDSFCKELAKKYPNVLAKDSSPLAVYGGSK